MTVLSVGGVRQLPQNFLLVRKIEQFRLKSGDEVISRVWCSLCFEESNATYHCVNCTLNLCTLCKESHERQRNTANHRIKNIMELRRARKQKQSQLDGLKFAPKCSLHAGFDMKSFCTTCQQLACADCLVLLHKGHNHETVAKVIHHYTKMLRDSAEQTRPLCNYAEHSIERLNEIGKGINRKCDEIQAQLQNFMQIYYKAVEVHGNTLFQQVQRARESKIEMILEQQMDLERRTHEAMEVVHFSQELTDNATDAEILSFVSIFNKRFEYCQQFKPPMDPKMATIIFNDVGVTGGRNRNFDGRRGRIYNDGRRGRQYNDGRRGQDNTDGRRDGRRGQDNTDGRRDGRRGQDNTDGRRGQDNTNRRRDFCTNCRCGGNARTRRRERRAAARLAAQHQPQEQQQQPQEQQQQPQQQYIQPQQQQYIQSQQQQYNQPQQQQQQPQQQYNQPQHQPEPQRQPMAVLEPGILRCMPTLSMTPSVNIKFENMDI